MILPYSTAKWLASAAFVFNIAAQAYGLLSTPNMKDVNDANLSFFSPEPIFVGIFFSVQQILQLAWLYRLWKSNPSSSSADPHELELMVDYVPYYAAGNTCIGVWMFFWNASQLKTANLFVLANTAAQLFYMGAKLAPLDLRSPASRLTHLVNKTFAGIAVLDLLQNSAAAYCKDQSASPLVKALTGLGFGVAGAAASDWVFGACLVYDLVALAVGQYSIDGGWGRLLGFFALALAVIVGIKNVLRPPYARSEAQYAAAAQDEDEA